MSAHGCVLAVVERGIRRGAIFALMMAQASANVELHDVEGFPEGQGLRNHLNLLDGFEPVADAMAAIVLVGQVLDEGP